MTLRTREGGVFIAPSGTPGADGDSAYDVAVAEGFVGDEAAWLASLIGPPGANGADGAPGDDGPPGDDGTPGDTGPGVATGGTDGQVLTKTSGVDFATAWETPASGGMTGLRVEEEGSTVVALATGLNFAGAGVTITDAGSDEALVTVTATVNDTDAALRARASHTGTQDADTLTDGATNHVFTAADDTKLTGIATGATANSSDATLLARANHTGTQLAATVSDFDTQVRTNRLDQMAAPTAAVPLGAQKITGLANGTVSTDAAAFGQIPTTFAPSGAAGGVLSGTYPNPGFAADMATQAELDTHAGAADPHAGYRLESVAIDTADLAAGAVTAAKVAADVATQAELDAAVALYVPKTLYDANSLLIATTDDTPLALTVAASRIVGRAASGDIDDLTPAQVRTIADVDQAGTNQPKATFPVLLEYALSDELTALTTGLKLTTRAPWAFTLTAVRISLTTASSSGTPTVDVKENGSTVLSTKPAIDVGELTSVTGTAAAISDSAIADDAELTFHVDVAGTGAKGLKVRLFGTRVAP